MLNSLIRFHVNSKVDYLVKLSISLALLCFVGPVVITMTDQMPITLQSLVVLFVSIAFGWRIGLPAVLFYLIAGGIGLPVFAGYRSGYNAFFGIYGGFFYGFIAASLISGYLAELEAFRKTIPAILNWFAGHLIILIFGAIWMMKFVPEEWMNNIKDVLPGAVIKSLVGAVLVDLIRRFMTRNRKEAFTED